MNVLEIWVHTTVQLYHQLAKWHWAASSWSYLDPDSSLYKWQNLLNNQGLSLVQTYNELLSQSSSGGKIKNQKTQFSGRNCVWSIWTPSVISASFYVHLRYKLRNRYSAAWQFRIWDDNRICYHHEITGLISSHKNNASVMPVKKTNWMLSSTFPFFAPFFLHRENFQTFRKVAKIVQWTPNIPFTLQDYSQVQIQAQFPRCSLYRVLTW